MIQCLYVRRRFKATSIVVSRFLIIVYWIWSLIIIVPPPGNFDGDQSLKEALENWKTPGSDAMVRRVKLVVGNISFNSIGKPITSSSHVYRSVHKLILLVESWVLMSCMWMCRINILVQGWSSYYMPFLMLVIMYCV